MEIWQAIVLGVVQGLTEFLPISSSGHLIIFPWLFDWETSSLSFDAALHLGTLLAVITYFRVEIRRMLNAIPTALANPIGLLRDDAGLEAGKAADARLGLLIIVATIPGAIAGLLFEDRINELFHTEENSDRAVTIIAVMLIVIGLVLWLAERVATRSRTMPGLKWLDALLIGCAQALALIPGTSRSGSTISAGLFRGLTRADAARFSFLAGMPLVLAAGLKSMYDVMQEGMTRHEVELFVAGAVSAALVGFVTISFLLKFLQRQSTTVFVVYRIVFGLFLLILLAVR